MKLSLTVKPSAVFPALCESFFNQQKSFDKDNVKELEHTLSKLIKVDFHNPELIIEFHNGLLFTIAYPANKNILALANLVMIKLVETVTAQVQKNADLYFNSGITGSMVCAQFGLLLNHWLVSRKYGLPELSFIDGDNTDLVTKLTFTLDPVEQELMPDKAGYFKHWKKQYIGELKSNCALLDYYVEACLQMTGSISFKENSFAHFQLYTQFRLDEKLNGLSVGRQTKGTVHFHHNGIQKKAAIETVLLQGQPVKVLLNSKEKEYLVNLARGTMASLLRETDTFTYAQTKETELFDAGNGITIALYYMVAEQKFALQSYVGYLLFKNGTPMAYGGCWLFAQQAAFGVNVLPPYRGGESANVVCQLLRLYHHRFQLMQFTVDPYQIGKGNDDGISSAAFWFYYKLGFRPMQENYAALAQNEMHKMELDRTYKTPKKILITLANSELFWEQKERNAVFYSLIKVSEKISKHVCEKYAGNRRLALQLAKEKYEIIIGSKLPEQSFLNNLLTTIDAMGGFEKLSPSILKHICKTYELKGTNEAKAFIDLQKTSAYFHLFDAL